MSKESGIRGYVNGMRNETEILEALNNKTFGSLSDHLKSIVKYMFSKVNDNDLIQVEKVPGFAKADLKITVNGTPHYLSVKYGHAATVHKEDVKVFVDYLKTHHIDEDTIHDILFYQYGDGTIDGTGGRRMSQQEYMRVYAKQVERINETLNSDRFFVRNFVNRVVFEGNDPFKQGAEFIYHGDIEEGFICSKESILSYVKRKTFRGLINPHIGPIMFRPYARYLDGSNGDSQKRHQVSFEWYRLEWDIEYIQTWKF